MQTLTPTLYPCRPAPSLRLDTQHHGAQPAGWRLTGDRIAEEGLLRYLPRGWKRLNSRQSRRGGDSRRVNVTTEDARKIIDARNDCHAALEAADVAMRDARAAAFAAFCAATHTTTPRDAYRVYDDALNCRESR